MPDQAVNGGFFDPPEDEPVRVVASRHSACGERTRVRLPAAVPARLVRRGGARRALPAPGRGRIGRPWRPRRRFGGPGRRREALPRLRRLRCQAGRDLGQQRDRHELGVLTRAAGRLAAGRPARQRHLRRGLRGRRRRDALDRRGPEARLPDLHLPLDGPARGARRRRAPGDRARPRPDAGDDDRPPRRRLASRPADLRGDPARRRSLSPRSRSQCPCPPTP